MESISGIPHSAPQGGTSQYLQLTQSISDGGTASPGFVNLIGCSQVIYCTLDKSP